MSPVRIGDTGIPRLQELSFLQVAMEKVLQDATYDEVRLALVDHAASLKVADAELAGTELRRFARANPSKFASNATESLAELMRLGMIEKAPLPSTPKVVDVYQGRHYVKTAAGEAWGQLLETSIQDAYDHLLRALWRRHKQFAGYLTLLSKGPFTVPTANWTDSNPPMAGAEGRGHHVRFLAKKAAAGAESGQLGWSASQAEIEEAIRSYTEARVKFADARHRPNPFPRSREFVRTCEEAMVTFAFRQARLQLDYISHEVLRRWTRDLGVANFSYHGPGPSALRLWLTADYLSEDSEPTFKRHVGDEWVERAEAEIPAAFERTRRMTRDVSWLPIYMVRAAVCVTLRVGDIVFDQALQRLISRAQASEAPYRVNLEIFDTGIVPPTEKPFRIRDSSGRERTYHRILITPVEERRAI
jgi:hypothetical protein